MENTEEIENQISDDEQDTPLIKPKKSVGRPKNPPKIKEKKPRTEKQIEAPPHFKEPLMNQRFRKHDKHSGRAARKVKTVQNEPRFDRFAQPHFVGQQHPRPLPGSHLICDKHLVRKQIHPSTKKSPNRAAQHFGALAQSLSAQIECVKFVHLPSQKTLLGAAEADRVRQMRLWNFFSPA